MKIGFFQDWINNLLVCCVNWNSEISEHRKKEKEGKNEEGGMEGEAGGGGLACGVSDNEREQRLLAR